VKHFKNLKRGMSLIEVMIALAIFALFGSSIFIMQQYLFNRMIVSKYRLLAYNRMQEALHAKQRAMITEFYEQKGLLEKSLEPEQTNTASPEILIKTLVTADFQGEDKHNKSKFSLFKNLYLLSVTAEHEQKNYGKIFIFSYFPEIKKS